MRPTQAIIDLAAVRHNVRAIRANLPPATRLIAVVKANAYGHGAIPVSRAALGAGADWLAVAIPEEGIELRAAGIRAVPGAIARRGAHIGKTVVLMPSFVHIGAQVGEGTMIDTWASVGSCAQVGSNCHISAGAGIGACVRRDIAVAAVAQW